MEKAKEKYRYFADKNQKIHPDFKCGDKVWLQKKHISTSRPSNKLDFRKIGPFTIIKKINSVAYKLNLPPSMKIHPVFHVSLLEPYYPNQFPNRTQPAPPPITINDQEAFSIKAILDSKYVRNKLMYLVDWEGYTAEEQSWEPAENIDAPDLIQQFHTKYPSKPGPKQKKRKEPQKGE